MSYVLNWNSNYRTQISIYKNWTEIYTKYTTNQNYWMTHYRDVEAGDIISRKVYTTVSGKGSPNNITDVTITYFWKPIQLAPTVVKDIWIIWVWTSFWEVNNEFKGWQFIWETTDVVTGSKALWNAVGYLVVNYNWNALKIPYYL